MKRSVANVLLVIVTVIWGGGFIATSAALDCFEPFYVLMIRFVGSALLSFLIAFRCVSVSGFCVSDLWAPGDHSKQERVSDDDQCGVRTLYFLDDLSQTADTAAGDGLAAVCHRHRAADTEGRCTVVWHRGSVFAAVCRILCLPHHRAGLGDQRRGRARHQCDADADRRDLIDVLRPAFRHAADRGQHPGAAECPLSDRNIDVSGIFAADGGTKVYECIQRFADPLHGSAVCQHLFLLSFARGDQPNDDAGRCADPGVDPAGGIPAADKTTGIDRNCEGRAVYCAG